MRYKFMRFPAGKTKALTLSYDDGVKADLRLSEIITKYGIKCTFNVNTSNFETNSPNKLTVEEIQTAIIDRGHEVAVHGERHIAPGNAEPVRAIADILNCRITLENTFNRIVRGMAYPDSGIRRMEGENNYPNIRGYVENLGIVYSRTLGGDNNSFLMPTDWYAWMPTAHHGNSKLMEYIEKFLKLDITPAAYHASRVSRLLYIWGHSYEFDRANNWERIEEICERLCDNDEIWYATNMEICEYVNAYKNLIYSADGHRIYNPTLFEIWIDIDSKLYSVKSGETLIILEN